MREVVVVGAGPVGLWLTRELRLAGIDVLVLERAEERAPHSRALTIHPRTLEVLAMRGLADDLLAEGVKIPNGHFAVLPHRLDFAPLDTAFPFTLALPQVRTEELLERYALNAGAEIRRGETVVDVRQDRSAATVRVEAAAGSYEVHARYVVGCDGAHSVVRESAGIAFPGTDSTTTGFLGDVILDDPPVTGFSAHNSNGLVMAVGLPGGVFRIVGVDPCQQDGTREQLRFEDFRDSVIRAAGTDFGMRDPVWLSHFRDTTRQVENYQQGRVLVAGDAAHVHFPTGGVGLNVGVQDAMNLGWKLAAVVQDRGTTKLLDTYHCERHAVGQTMLEFCRAQTALITAFSPSGQALRSLVDHLVSTNARLSLALAARLSALDVAYPPAHESHPLVGQRAPDLAVSDGHRSSLYQLLHEGRPIMFTNAAGSSEAIQQQPGHADIVTCDGGLDIADRTEWRGITNVLVRPDGHVAWVTQDRQDPALAVDAATAALYAPD